MSGPDRLAPPDAVRLAHGRLTGAFSLDAVPPVKARQARLRALDAALGAARDDLARALDADFAPRAEMETLTAELMFTREGLRHAIKHLPRWARARTSRVLRPVPARTDVWSEPKGAVAVLSPWNYPVQLALGPFAAAVAAGNRVLLKPSERAPATAEALARLVSSVFPEDEAVCIAGDVDAAEAVTALPWGHLFYTGSTEIGRKVARACAETLTPVTLELGGRSPALALPDAEPARHAGLIAWGAVLNAGQTCVAPNHLWVPRARLDEWAEALIAGMARFGEGDLTGLIDDRARARADALRREAREAGVEIREARPGGPAVVVDPPDHLALWREEVFAPLLPLRPYDDVEEVIAAEAGATPLAAYVFGRDAAEARGVLARIRSGGGAVNAVVMHLAAHDLPFGGIGTSGQGAYHGRRGFREFSHERSVLTAGPGPWRRLLLPPYAPTVLKVLRRMAG